MSGVFAASLQGAAVWKSRVPQKWFNPNYPVSVSASAPSPLLSCPHAAIFCRWISTYNVTFAAVNCEIWNQRQSEITSSRNMRPLFWCCSFTTRVNHEWTTNVDTELEYCWKLCHPQRPVTMLQCHGQMSRRLQQLPCPNCKCAAIVYRLIADIQLRNSILIMTMIYTINSV